MAIVTLTEDNFEQVVTGGGIVLVDCWAAWCGACKDFAPVYERVAEANPEHTYGAYDTQKNKAYTSELGIDHIPTLLLFRDGLLLFKQPGYYEEKALEDIIKQAESLDMDEVRAAIAADSRAKSPESKEE